MSKGKNCSVRLNALYNDVSLECMCVCVCVFVYLFYVCISYKTIVSLPLFSYACFSSPISSYFIFFSVAVDQFFFSFVNSLFFLLPNCCPLDIKSILFRPSLSTNRVLCDFYRLVGDIMYSRSFQFYA